MRYPGVSCFSKLAEVLSMPLTGLRWWCAADDAGLFVAIVFERHRNRLQLEDQTNNYTHTTLNCLIKKNRSITMSRPWQTSVVWPQNETNNVENSNSIDKHFVFLCRFFFSLKSNHIWFSLKNLVRCTSFFGVYVIFSYHWTFIHFFLPTLQRQIIRFDIETKQTTHAHTTINCELLWQF